MAELSQQTKEAFARALAVFMGDLSERGWCAGWLTNLEYSLWEIVDTDRGKRWLGQIEVTQAEIETMRELSRLIDGWVYWDEDDQAAEGATYVPMADWLRIVAKMEARPWLS